MNDLISELSNRISRLGGSTFFKEINTDSGSFILCSRCILRLIGITQVYPYCMSEHDIQKALDVGLNNLDNTNNIDQKSSFNSDFCPLCLGLLSDRILNQQVQSSVSVVTSDYDYHFSSFSLELSLHVSTYIRMKCLWSYLTSKLAGIWKSHLTKITSLKDVLRWVLSKKISDEMDIQYDTNAKFHINFSYISSHLDKETSLFLKHVKKNKNDPEFTKTKHNKISWTTVTPLLNSLSSNLLENAGISSCGYPPSPLSQPFVYLRKKTTETLPNTTHFWKTLIYHDSVFLKGRYKKYDRTVSQSKWSIKDDEDEYKNDEDTGNNSTRTGNNCYRTRQTKVSESVEEIIANKIVPIFDAEDYKFHCGGREDIDVRMLGNGRMFILELIKPHKNLNDINCNYLVSIINQSSKKVQISSLCQSSRKDFSQLITHAEAHDKIYRCICYTRPEITHKQLEQISNLRNITLHQRTPIRVLHRRALMNRERVIYELKAWFPKKTDNSNNYFYLSLHTQSGTYIKEFIHGDRGRTQPSLGELVGQKIDILQLDVLGVLEKEKNKL